MMIDEGQVDIKVIAVPFQEPTWNAYQDIEDLPPHIISEIKHFFGVYKQLEGKTMTVLEIHGREPAYTVIEQSIDDYNEKYCKK